MKKLTNFCVNLAQRFLPDPFLFALLLSAVMFVIGILFNHQTPFEMIIHWGNGFWSFLAFGMQMALVMFPAGAALGIDPALTTMSLCWGDTWTNMIQPFWALPALGIAKLGVRDIMGFCVVVTLWSGIIVSTSMIVWTLFF